MCVFCMINELLPIGGFFRAKEKENFDILKINYLSKLIVKAISLFQKFSTYFLWIIPTPFMKRKFCFDIFANSFHANNFNVLL